MKKTVFVFTILLAVALSGCYNGTGADYNPESQILQASADLEVKKLKTIDEAMNFYLQEKEANKYGKGDFFAASYRILDEELQERSITVYAHILCEWINGDGEVVSGGAGVIAVTFKKSNDTYEYEKSDSYDFPQESDIPQKVKDALSNDSYFAEMRSEVDQDIADFLESIIK